MPRGRGNRGQNSGGRGRGRGGGDRGLPNRGAMGGRGRGRGNPPSSQQPSRRDTWLEPGIQTSHTLDLFNDLPLSERDDSIVFEGNFEDFSLGNSFGKSNPSRQPSSRSTLPDPAPTHQHRGGSSFRGRGGPWRGRASLLPPPLPLAFSSVGQRGGSSFRGNGIGLGFLNGNHPSPSPKLSKRSMIKSRAPRISLAALERDRPLLKPVTFVRGEHQTLLFKEQEEILHVPGEEREHADQVLPSANTVERIFHPEILDDNDDDEEVEKSDSDSQSGERPDSTAENSSNPVTRSAIEVQIQDDVSFTEVIPDSDALVIQQDVPTTTTMELITKSEGETDITPDSNLPPSTSEHQPVSSVLDKAHSPEPALFIISTNPDALDADNANINDNIQYDPISSQAPVGITSDDEVVYEAPNSHLRSHLPKETPTTELTSNQNHDLNSTSLSSLTITPASTSDLARRTVKAQILSGLKVTPRMRRMMKYENNITRGSRKNGVTRKRRLSLLARGLQREEKMLESDAGNLGREKKGMKAQRRKGSDIEWGSTDGSSDLEVEEENVQEGLEPVNRAEQVEESVDPDIDIKDLIRFVRGVEELSRGNGTGDTIDDLEDKAKMKEEDETVERRGSSTESTSSEDEGEEEGEEEIEDDLSSVSSDISEEVSFQTKLKNLRSDKKREGQDDAVKQNGKGKQKAIDVSSSEDEDEDESEDEDEDDDFEEFMEKADKDEKYLSEIQGILNENEIWLHSHGSRKGRKNKQDKNKRKKEEKFKAILNASFEYDDLWDISFNTRKKDKAKNLPPSLKERWELDRIKKAERKRERQLQRELEEMELSQAKLALSLSPSGKSKLSKLEKGLLRKTGKDSATPVSDDALEIQYTSPATIRISKITRLETLEHFIRTTFLPNLEIDTVILPPKDKAWRKEAHDLAMAFHLKKRSEGKEGNRFMILSRTSRSGIAVKETKISRVLRNEGVRRRVKIRTRDGDEVGAAAPKIDSSNIGFKILEKMGWTEGQRIGVVGGLADPLTAIIKTSKLGLGATR